MALHQVSDQFRTVHTRETLTRNFQSVGILPDADTETPSSSSKEQEVFEGFYRQGDHSKEEDV